MSGNAIYYGLVAMFFAQMYNVDLSMTAYAAIIFTSTLGAIGQAGVPGPSFLVVAVLLAAGILSMVLPLLFAFRQCLTRSAPHSISLAMRLVPLIMDKYTEVDVKADSERSLS